ncbi:MAG: hypothetical protein FJ189_00475 [Gammaproteobacteria bacterium]|nr:hypothetical protein [Gammaproteobacteria bacterium]
MQLLARGGLTPGDESIVDVTTATLTVTAAKHAGKIITLNRAAGITVTLPAATGSGMVYEFVVGTTVTSNNDIIKVANASDVFKGFVVQAQDAGATANIYETAATDDTLTMNGTTTGGLAGDRFTFRDVKLNGTTPLWLLQGFMAATGTEATPLSATV